MKVREESDGKGRRTGRRVVSRIMREKDEYGERGLRAAGHFKHCPLVRKLNFEPSTGY